MSPFVSSTCLYVISGPCGSGKTSVAMRLLAEDPQLGYTPSVTTKRPRDPTKATEHYDYVSRETFMERAARGDFVQWIHPSYDEYYGTRRAPIDAALAAGRDMVFDYCPEGYLNLRRAYPEHVVGIFLMAPDLETLRRRLSARGTEYADELALRYQMALQDLNFVDAHEYHVVNHDLGATLETIRAILRAEKARTARQRRALDGYRDLARPALLRYYDSPPAASSLADVSVDGARARATA